MEKMTIYIVFIHGDFTKHADLAFIDLNPFSHFLLPQLDNRFANSQYE